MAQRLTPQTSGRREGTSPVLGSPESRRRALRARRLRRGGMALTLVAPAALTYFLFVVRPIAQTVQYSFYDWDGVTPSTWVGLANYVALFHDPELSGSIGLDGIARAWLGDFDTALPAVGVIGAWVLFGLCMLLLLAGMTKIDPGLYEAARIDGAGPLREFVSITLPSLRQEVVVCVTVTVIAALASFDIVHISTQGGPGNSTLVPGLEIYYLAFFQREVGQASALAVALMALVLAVVLPLQWLNREGDS